MSADLSDLHLTPFEVQSTAWQKLDKHYRAVLMKKRARLENTSATHEERAALCWEIKTIKGFLAHAGAAEKNGAAEG